jgi:hypothetical protein
MKWFSAYAIVAAAAWPRAVAALVWTAALAQPAALAASAQRSC